MNLRRAWLCAVVALSAGVALAQDAAAPAPPADALSGQALIDAVGAGGLVIYFRHTATDFSRRDDAMKGFDDCENQRPLSAQGRADATMLGQRIRALRLPVNDVLASPMCRTMEHAKLTFGRATPTAELRERHEGDYPGLRRLLIQPVPNGRNRWIVSHGNPIRTVTALPQLAEGEAVVLRPESTRWTVLGRITVGEWAGLTAARPTARPPR